ncbi:MAG: sugar phosphate isomerase/epimerase family protein [Kouleothrix sp.]|jgi:sugar phosphate isomerase/epimerase|nr:sugar phosphate isomerase/epimerase [Kouleothrix sp.]
MARPVTLFTGQWADLPLEELARKARNFGYDGLELACWGDHFEVDKALEDDGYLRRKRELLDAHGLRCVAISSHLVGQCVADALIDERHKGILPAYVWGDGRPEGVRQRAAEELQKTAQAARAFGVTQINGFTGSPIWHLLYSFPPNNPATIAAGYREFADRWNPIMDAFDAAGVRFGLEVHPTEIAYDIATTELTLAAIGRRPAFGINFDPSHLHHQFVDPVLFLETFADRIYHVHVKESRRNLNGRTSILGSHLNFGDPRRGWDFVSPGHGGIEWGPIFRTLTRIGYTGPLSVEWEDSGMDREFGAAEACALVKRNDFPPSRVAFDAAFQK